MKHIKIWFGDSMETQLAKKKCSGSYSIPGIKSIFSMQELKKTGSRSNLLTDNIILILLILCFVGCASSRDTRQGSSHIPPLKSPIKSQIKSQIKYPTYQTPSTAPSPKSYGKKTGTQKPYKIRGIRYTPIANADGFLQTGLASWYGRKFHGRKTANGETYNMYAMTAAHKTLPMNTRVSVHNLKNNRKIVVRINDRGPFVSGRIIDLSYTGAKRLGIVKTGTAQVRINTRGKVVSSSKKAKKPVSFQSANYWKNNFTVQVGAFKNKSNAVKYKYQLAKSYHNAHIIKDKNYKDLVYRVRVGRFANIKDAERFTEKIINQGFHNAFAVAE